MKNLTNIAQENQISNITRTTVIILLLLTPTLTNLLEHAGSGIMLVLTIIGIYTFYTSRYTFEYRIISFSSWEKAIMGVFALYFVFSLLMIASHNISNGISILKTDVEHEVRMLTFLSIYYLFVRIKPSKEIIWYSVIAGAIASGLYGFTIYFAAGFSSRVVGPYNPILFGCVAVALAFMSLSSCWFFYQKNKKLILLPLLGFACGLLAAFLSGTRGAVIAIPFLFVIFIFQVRSHISTNNTKVVFAGITAVFIFLSLVFPHTRVADRFEKGIEQARIYINNYDCVDCVKKHEAAYLRLWGEALIIIKDHPLTGVGPDGFKKIVTERTENQQIAPGIERFKTPHNMYLTMFTFYGLGGLIVLIVFFMVPFVGLAHTIRNSEENDNLRDISYCGLFLIVGYMLFSMTETLFIRNIFIAFYLIMLAAIISACRTLSKL